MQKKDLGNRIAIGLVLLNIIIWLLFPPQNDQTGNYTRRIIGEVIASSTMILISIGLVLTARPRFLEPFFGGLDKMLQTHKKLSMLAFLLIIIHFFSIPKTDTLVDGKPIGMLAFLGIIILVLLTIAPRVPLISTIFNWNYGKWRVAHKLMGVFFILGLVHYLLVDTISKQTAPGSYMLLISFIGIVAYIYRQFFSRMFEPYRDYIVEKVNHLNGTCIEIQLKPKDKPISFKAGQFVYIYFKDKHGMREPHPFTVSSAPNDDELRLTIKASGDWTRYLVKNLKPSMDAGVHGGFGMFDYRDGGKEQVWIAGGIGVTPFLIWVRDMNGKPEHEVDFFYGVRSQADALFWNEFKTLGSNNDSFRPHLQISLEEGHLSAEDIAKASRGNITDKHIYLCGPVKMTEGFARTFKEMGVPAKNVHYEEFNFR